MLWVRNIVEAETLRVEKAVEAETKWKGKAVVT